MMKTDDIKNVYFIGIGGIGMSALVRYFLAEGKSVAGYDRTLSPLTKELSTEGVDIHYEENVAFIPEIYLDKTETLVVYTPAVPSSHTELNYFKDHGFEIMKRAQALGLITETKRGICVAGTHGKTTTSSMIAHILKQSSVDCSAFLGGILKNYNSNCLLSHHSDLTVVEADEFDRSFHHLKPYMAVVTAVDPDHLDIYGTPEAYRESFEKFTSLIRPDGVLLMKKDISLTSCLADGVKSYTYSVMDQNADFHAENIKMDNGEIFFDFVASSTRIDNIQLGVPVEINVENAIAATAIAWLNGVKPNEIRVAMRSYTGVLRRFDFQIKTPKIVYIDDYAHHPEELLHSIQSVKALYPTRKLTGVFQPHLYTRTRDFAVEFAEALSHLDKLILLDIYPAREEPIPGITSEIIFDKVTVAEKQLCHKENLVEILKKEDIETLITLGAGDIDRLVTPIKNMLNEKYA